MLKQIYRFINPRFQNLFLEYKVDFKPRVKLGEPLPGELYTIIDKNRKKYSVFCDSLVTLKERFWELKDYKQETDPSMPTINNGFLPILDMFGIYGLLKEFQPKKYVEIGSGTSTKVANLAKQEFDLNMEIISIDPVPREAIDRITDRVIRQPFESIDIDIIEMLNDGDVLFIDNSHRILPNSDSLVFYLEVLPRLKSGVIVHIHDIYLPYDYPQFMCDRFYSEQYGLAFYLLAASERFEILLPNYFISQDKNLSDLLLPIWSLDKWNGVERHGGSFWFKIV